MRCALIMGLFVLVPGCLVQDRAVEPGPTTDAPPTFPAPTGPFAVASDAFQHMQPIPREHTCDDANRSPPLEFTNLPVNATAVALIMEDPDAPPMRTILHWTFWNLPRNATMLGKGESPTKFGAKEGKTYGGPCPPVGTHRYFFYAFAQTEMLSLEPTGSAEPLRAALQGKTAATAQMYGTYTRPAIPPVGEGSDVGTGAAGTAG